MGTNDYVDKITDKIYLGCASGAYETEYLQTEGVTHILSAVQVDTPEFTRKFINIGDFEEENIFTHFKTAIEFIESGDKIYIHCLAGISRSPTFVIAYLMWKNKLTYNDAYWIVKNRRRYVYPNSGFIEQLKKFEKALIENEYDLEKIDFNI